MISHQVTKETKDAIYLYNQEVNGHIRLYFPINSCRAPEREDSLLQFSCSVEAGQGDNPRTVHTFPTLSVTGYSPIY